jgi:hypothetical protein
MLDISHAFRRFRDLANDGGFAKNAPEQVLIHDRVTFDVSGGVAGSDTGTPAKKNFFAVASGNMNVKTQDPLLTYGVGIPADVMVCVYGASLKFNHVSYAGTLTETKEVIAALADSVLVGYAGSDRIIEAKGEELLMGPPGFVNGTDTATAAATSIGGLVKSEGLMLPVPKVIGPGAIIKFDYYVNKSSWTTNDDFDVDLYLHAWVARRGQASRNPTLFAL